MIDDVFVVFKGLPLWAAPIGALGFLFFFVVLMPAILKDPPWSAYDGLFVVVGWAFALLVLVAGMAGAIERAGTQWENRRRLDRQTGIDSIRAMGWDEFEPLVGEAYGRRGYAWQLTAPGADGGVDIILTKDGWTTYVQCKQWLVRKIRVEHVRAFYGAMAAAGVRRGIFVTSGTFTSDALRFANQTGIATVDGSTLATMIREVQPTVATVARVTESSAGSCPICGSYMVRRTARRGQFVGQDFLGCSRYPACRGTRSLA